MKKGLTIIELFIVIAIVTVFVVIIAVIAAPFVGTPNNGQHTGIVTSVEQEGVIWKTWRAYVKTSAQSTQEDQYCVTDPTIVTKLQEVAASTTEVTVRYSRGFFVPPWQCGDETSIINSVK